ncbi:MULTISPECIES: toxin VasX [unclassified Neptuniibacter]|uniref:toxin VasX n=1 Tax=unclassified Neptuniibacter TaxID=2630693 RepID=UPI0025E90CCD|nr:MULTISPECIES: toxin VasX [unclassified Neptuniibacter]|tara:strand:+ start:26824 stop:30360 length:3537 start_codon:yes stop_codon:yes gene_type:complete
MSRPKSSCLDCDFFISVNGISHDTTQSFQFYDHSDQVQQEYIEAKQKLLEQSGYSIFSWNWTPETEKRNVWLSIECEEGGPIKLPLFTAVDEQKYQEKENNYEQNYHLQAVVPLTILPSVQPAQYPEQHMAPTRNGYLYIFKDNQLWREVEIINKENIGPEFRDTHLYQHREGFEKPFKKGPRKALGKPLKDIWLPTKANSGSQRLYVAYSEVQWSAAYLNFLEHPENRNLLKQRTSVITHQSINTLGDKLNTTLKTMRLREPEIEEKLADPSLYNRDLNGNYLYNLYDGVSYEVNSLRKDSSNLLSTLENGTHQRLEYGARAAQYTKQLNADSQEDSLWQARSSIDYLADARARQLKLIALPDPIFELRHHTSMAMQVSSCLFHIMEDAGQQKYFQSAELVQRFVVPDKLPNGEENPNHKHLDSFNFSPIGVFQRTLRTIERQRCHQDMAQFQKNLGKTIDKSATAAAVRDFTSLERGAPGAYRLVGNAFQALSLNLAAIDPLQDKQQLKENQQPQDWPGQATIANFYTQGASHPLHALLYPPADQVPLDTAYTSPAPVNDGSGQATTDNIARWAGDTLIKDDQIENLDQALLLAENSEDGFGGSRRLLNTADGVLSGFFTAMLALQNKADARISLSQRVETVEFNAAYLDNLRLSKLIAPDSLGQATYIPTSGESIAGAYVVGVHSKKAGLSFGLTEAQRKQTSGKRYGVLRDSNDKLLASTNQRSLKGTKLQGAAVSSKVDLRALVIPDDNPITQMKVEQLAKQADLADKLEPQSKAGGAAGQFYAKGLPYFIVALEIVNLQRTVAAFEGKSASYATVSGISASWDLGVAIVNASNFLTRETGRLATYSTKTVIKLPPSAIRFLSAPSLGLHLEKNLSRLKAAGLVGGALTTAVAVWDTCLLISAQDNDAAAAMAMVALGTGLSTFGSLYTATFLMSPLGWIGLTIALVGFGLYMLFKDSPMETWLKNGPFGARPDHTGDYKYLQQPNKAWQHFINLIMNLRIKTYAIDQIELSDELRRELAGKGITHGVWLTSNLFGLSKPEHQTLRFHARQAVLTSTEKITKMNLRRDPPTKSVDQVDTFDAPLLYQHKQDNGYIFFYRFDKTVPRNDGKYRPGTTYLYKYQAHFHTRAQLQIGDHTFPTPPLSKEEDAGSPSRTPTFREGEYWWANEFGWEQ